jgi:glycosyltransferase involved in cell wall biosynthesis
VLSNHTREVVQAALGEDYLVRAIPAPIFDRRPHGGVGTKRPQNQAREIRVAGEIVDSRHFVISPDAMEHKHPELFSRGDLGSENVHLSFDLDSDDRGYLVGFYTAEAFGSWSRIPEPWVMLPFTVSQPVKLTLVLGAYGPNVDRTITVSLGGDSHEIRLTSEAQTVAFTFHPSEPSNVLRFQTLDITPVPGAEDVRTMGISLCTLDVSPVPVVIPARRRAMARLRTLTRSAEKSELQPADKASLTLDGVVFTCVLNPVDGRKNWRDIVTAFCFAMRDNPNATLVLKMTHHSIASFFAELQLTLYRIGQVQCRVVAIRGFLEDEDYDRLLQATSFYINASLAEGLCMPLMEYMSGGVPAIAARNTAMLDYAYPESTFLVESSPQMTSWPHDTRFMLRTRYHQVNWESLVQAIRDSYEVAESDPARYQEMCQAATDVQASFCSDAVVSAALREALDLDQDL